MSIESVSCNLKKLNSAYMLHLNLKTMKNRSLFSCLTEILVWSLPFLFSYLSYHPLTQNDFLVSSDSLHMTLKKHNS